MSIVSNSEDPSEDVGSSGVSERSASGVASEASFPASISSSSPKSGFSVISSVKIEDCGSTCSATIIPAGFGFGKSSPSDRIGRGANTGFPADMIGPGTVKNSPEEIIGPWTGSKLNVPEEMIGPPTGSEEISPEDTTGPVIGRETYFPWEMTGPVTGLDNMKLPVETTGFEIGTDTDGPEDTISSFSVFSLEDSFFFCDRRKRNSS